MDSHPLQQDAVLGDIDPEISDQEPQRTCTRGKPCYGQGCLLCRTSSTHIRNLEADLDNSNASSTPLTTNELPPPPPGHPILILTSAFQRAIQKKDSLQLKSYIKQYIHNLDFNIEFLTYDCSDLHASCQEHPGFSNCHQHPFALLPTQRLNLYPPQPFTLCSLQGS